MATIGTVEGYLVLTDQFTAVLDRAMTALQKSSQMMNTNLGQMNAALDATSKAQKRMGESAKTAAKDTEAAAKSAKSSAVTMGDLRAAYAVAAIGIWRFVDGVIAAQQATDRMRNALLAGTGDINKVGQELTFVRGEADRLGLNFANAGVQFGKLAAAARGTGVSMNTLHSIFSAIGEASTALGLSAEDSQGALNAIVQMLAKGSVQAEELRGQLGDRLPVAVNAMARALGVGTGELMKMLEQGKVIADDQTLSRFAEEIKAAVGPGVISGAQAFNAELNRLKNSLYDMFSTIAESSALSDLTRGMREFVEVINEMMSNGGGAAFFEDLSRAITTSLGVLGKLLSLYSTLKGLADSAVGAGGSGLSSDDLTPVGMISMWLEGLEGQFEQSKREIDGWAESAVGGTEVIVSGMSKLSAEAKAAATDYKMFLAEVAATGHALSSDELVAAAKKENAENVKKFREALDHLTKSTIEFKKANDGALDLEEKLQNQAQELAIFNKLLKENGGDYNLAKRQAQSYYQVLKAGLNPLKGWGKSLYDLAKSNDAAEESLRDFNKEVKDFERNSTRLSKEFNKEWEKSNSAVGASVSKLGKDLLGMLRGFESAGVEAGRFWGKLEASSRGRDAFNEFNKEAAITDEILARLGARTDTNAVAYDRMAAEIRESLGAIIDYQNEMQRIVDLHEGIAAGLSSMDWGSDGMNSAARGLASMVSALGLLRTATKLFSQESAAAWSSMLQGIQTVLEATGAFQTGNGGGFGGTSEGNYAAEGQMVGAIIGGIIGASVSAPQAGMAIGGAAGGILGGFIKKGAEEALASVYINTDGFTTLLAKAEGDLGGSITQLGNSIGAAITDIVSSIGGHIASLPVVQMKIRDGVIGVVVGGVQAKFKEMDDAISFAVAELLKQGDILGIDEMLRDALKNTTSESMESLSRDLESVMKVLSFGMTESQQSIQAFTNELDGLRGQMTRLLSDSGQLARAMGNLAAEEARRWQMSRDALTGDKKTNAEKLAILQRDAEMWNAEKAIRIADLRLQALETQRKLDLFRADVELVKAGGKLFNAKYEMDRARLIAERDLSDAQNSLYQQDLNTRQAYIEAQAALLQVQLDAINQLVGVLVDIPDIDVPSLHLPSAGGGSVGNLGSGISEREQREIDFLEFLDGYRLEGLSAVARSLDELESAFAEQAQAASEVEDGEIRLAAARRVALAQIREEVIDAFGSPMEELRDRISEIRQQVEDWFAVNDELGEQFLNNEISLQQLLDALAEANVLWAEFGDMARQELLGLAAYFTDAMGNTEESARIREELAEMEWDFNRLQMQMLIETWAELGILSQAAADHWRDFIATLPENRPGDIGGLAGGGNSALQAAITRLRNAIEALRESNENLLLSTVSPLSVADQFAEAERIYNETLAAAQGGDLQAIEDFASVRDQYLELAAAMYGTAGAGYASIFQQSLEAGQDLAAAGQAILDAIPPQMQGVEDRLDTIAEILAAIEAAQVPVETPPGGPGEGGGLGGGGVTPPGPHRPPGDDPQQDGGSIWDNVGGTHPPPGSHSGGPMGGRFAGSNVGDSRDAVDQLRALNANMLLLMQAVETQARETRNLSLMRTPATLPGGRRR